MLTKFKQIIIIISFLCSKIYINNFIYLLDHTKKNLFFNHRMKMKFFQF